MPLSVPPPFAGAASPAYGATGISVPLNANVPLVAGGSTFGFDFSGTINPGATSYAAPVAVLTRSDLTIAGDLSKITGTTDLLSANLTTTFAGVTGGPVTTMGGAQVGLYIGTSAGITFNGLRAQVLHIENNSVNTITLLIGVQPVLTNNAGTISNLRWYDVPDSSATPGGGSITNEWSVYSPNALVKLFNAGRADLGSVNVSSSTVPANGVYLSAASTLSFSSNSGARFSLTSAGLSANAGTGARIVSNSNAAATVPVFIPNQGDTKAGIGADAAGDVSIIANNGGTATEKIRVTGTQVLMLALPTANPTIAGALWNNAGVLTVSGG